MEKLIIETAKQVSAELIRVAPMFEKVVVNWIMRKWW